MKSFNTMKWHNQKWVIAVIALAQYVNGWPLITCITRHPMWTPKPDQCRSILIIFCIIDPYADDFYWSEFQINSRILIGMDRLWALIQEVIKSHILIEKGWMRGWFMEALELKDTTPGLLLKIYRFSVINFPILVPLNGHSDNKIRVFCKDGKNEVLSSLFLALATT